MSLKRQRQQRRMGRVDHQVSVRSAHVHAHVQEARYAKHQLQRVAASHNSSFPDSLQSSQKLMKTRKAVVNGHVEVQE